MRFALGIAALVVALVCHRAEARMMSKECLSGAPARVIAACTAFIDTAP
jgi:hypothetical protein